MPIGPKIEEQLRVIAGLLSDDDRKVSPLQVAAQILEEATASYFRQVAGSGEAAD